MRNILIGLALVAVVSGGALLSTGFADKGAADIKGVGLPIAIMVKASELRRDQSFEAAQASGRVRFEGGWALTSDFKDFGGFSGLIIDDESKNLLAISDKGDWWQAPFDAQSSVPPMSGTVQRFSFGAKAAKIDLDAESLIKFNGGYLVSFEHNHRLEFVSEIGAAPSKPLLSNIDFSGISGNGGMEAIAHLETGQVLAFSEKGLNGAGHLQAWLVSADNVQTLKFQPPKNFSPTDAAVMPNGDVLVLMRHFSAIDGVAIKVLVIKADDIIAGAVLTGQEVLHLTPEFTVDNMEGLDVVALDADTIRLVMISDDNFNPLQRTLLMMFDYDYR